MSIQRSIQALYQCLRTIKGDSSTTEELKVSVCPFDGEDYDEDDWITQIESQKDETEVTWEHPYYGEVTLRVVDALLADPKIQNFSTFVALLYNENHLANRILRREDTNAEQKIYGLIALQSTALITQSLQETEDVTIISLETYRNMCYFYPYNQVGVVRSINDHDLREWIYIVLSAATHFGILPNTTVVVEIGNGIQVAFKLNPEDPTYPEWLVVYRDWKHCAILSLELKDDHGCQPSLVTEARVFGRVFDLFFKTYLMALPVSNIVEYDGNTTNGIKACIRQQREPFLVKTGFMVFGTHEEAAVFLRFSKDSLRFMHYRDGQLISDEEPEWDWEAFEAFINRYQNGLSERSKTKHLN